MPVLIVFVTERVKDGTQRTITCGVQCWRLKQSRKQSPNSRKCFWSRVQWSQPSWGQTCSRDGACF